MKIAKNVKRKGLVVRVSYEPDWDDEAWDSAEIQPVPESHPDAFYRVVKPAYLRAKAVSERRTPHSRLSARQLRKRLNKVGVSGAQSKAMIQEIMKGPDAPQDSVGRAFMSWNTDAFRQRFGRRVARAVMRFVQIHLIVFDEFGSYVTPGFADFVRQTMTTCRKFNAFAFLAEQEPMPATPESSAVSLGFTR